MKLLFVTEKETHLKTPIQKYSGTVHRYAPPPPEVSSWKSWMRLYKRKPSRRSFEVTLRGSNLIRLMSSLCLNPDQNVSPLVVSVGMFAHLQFSKRRDLVVVAHRDFRSGNENCNKRCAFIPQFGTTRTILYCPPDPPLAPGTRHS